MDLAAPGCYKVAMKSSPKLNCPPSLKNEGRGLKVQDEDRALAALAKALGHPARVKILRHLAKTQACLCGDIVPEIGLAQPTVSRHLKTLKAAGFIRGPITGPKSCYCLEPTALAQLERLLGPLKRGKAPQC
jgi:ArsR family transcriptional regulator